MYTRESPIEFCAIFARDCRSCLRSNKGFQSLISFLKRTSLVQPILLEHHKFVDSQ